VSAGENGDKGLLDYLFLAEYDRADAFAVRM
jgi:hypothetical protein